MSLNDIIGQDMCKFCLRALIKKPTEAPKIVIIAGPEGTGRKTLAYNYIEGLVCSNVDKEGNNCGTCLNCRGILNNSTEFKEYESIMINSIEYTPYIVVNNFDSCPVNIQVDFYNWFNNQEVKPKIVLIVKDTDKVIDSLISLSLILRTHLLTEEEIKVGLTRKIRERYAKVEEESINLIAKRSRGNLSLAYKMLDKYFILDKDLFKQQLFSARELYICFLISCYRNKKEDVEKYLTQLKEIPLVYLKMDYESLIVEILKVATKIEEPKDQFIKLLMSEIKAKTLDLYYIMNDKVIYNSFQNDDTFQSAMYIIYLKLTNKIR